MTGHLTGCGGADPNQTQSMDYLCYVSEMFVQNLSEMRQKVSENY